MTAFTISNLPISSILFIYTEKDRIQIDPPYQRQSDVWTLEKRQLLIDSILNGFDVPKIYFHKFVSPRRIDGGVYDYAIIDGKQRLESLWRFIEGDFALSDSFEYLHDPSLRLAGLNYGQLARQFPQLKIRFDAFPLSIVSVDTEDEDLIEDLFSRLNEAVPLSAAEKRNALGGPIPPAIRRIARHKFFSESLPFSNKRYRHYDLAAKVLVIEDVDGVADTKKVYLDKFVENWKERGQGEATSLTSHATAILDALVTVFVSGDPLLRSAGTTILYYHMVRIAKRQGWLQEVSRNKLLKFEQRRLENRSLAEDDISKANYDLLEYDRFVQTPNDAYATKFRLGILLQQVFERSLPEEEAKSPHEAVAP